MSLLRIQNICSFTKDCRNIDIDLEKSLSFTKYSRHIYCLGKKTWAVDSNFYPDIILLLTIYLINFKYFFNCREPGHTIDER